ncbi:NAD(P)H-dependent oxidoreductase subunit E [Acidiferrimicrobium sp. IK]|uniref:NADH-quinone oxidoreductase subunit NuoE family protein n=1 Tax=Acidiferrimicrobium sp. IK TaxID=2871700 RepID=UPI0021CB553B|nr:NAD(P)H-dependent oxidoreductase subunit E [Acidiferrimicrobium sp. IK]MCU4183166.1 NAD(P)H-dependent oxidoreductase subunit E [Acidiferrimicrobium sp. IK]
MARLTPANEERARQLIALYPHHRSALIPILHILQGQDGYLSEDGMHHVGELLGLTAAEVRGTATFYDMFHVEPVGKYVVAVCTNIACMLQGAYELLEAAEDQLGIAPGGTTPDGMFTLEDAECLALCGNAPCATVNWRFFGDLDPERFAQLTEDLRAGRLDAEVPPHGVLSRVDRNVGLRAAGQSVHGAGGPPVPARSGQNSASPEPLAVEPDADGGQPAGPHDAGVELRTTLSTTAVIAHEGGRGLDRTGTRTTAAPDGRNPQGSADSQGSTDSQGQE